MTPALSSRSGVERLLSEKRVVVTCGAGGVGKTTTAAALALLAARRAGARVLVITVDPARRLADSLGVAGIANEPRRVGVGRGNGPDGEAGGELWAAMLDAKTCWDDLVRAEAPSARVAAEILHNEFYKNITSRFAHAQDYIAMERLYELHQTGVYDLIVVDTPPAVGALDLLDAPQRIVELFSSKTLRVLTVPTRAPLVGLASRPLYHLADRILGSTFLAEMAAFFTLFDPMYPGFIERAEAVSAVLQDPQSTFVVVTTAEDSRVAEASGFIDSLDERDLEIGLVVANRVLPETFLDGRAASCAAGLTARAPELAVGLGGAGDDASRLASVLREIGGNFANFAAVAARERALLESFSGAQQVALVPHLMRDVADLEALGEIADRLEAG